MRTTSLIDCYPYIKAPYDMENLTRHVTIEPKKYMIGVNNDHSVCIAITKEQLNQCNKLKNRVCFPASQFKNKIQRSQGIPTMVSETLFLLKVTNIIISRLDDE